MKAPFVISLRSFPAAVAIDFSDGARALVSRLSDLDMGEDAAPIVLSFYSKWGRFKGAAGISYLGEEMEGGAKAVADALKSIDGGARYARPALEALSALA